MKPDEILSGLADLFREKNAQYKDNYQKTGDILKVLFPEGIVLNEPDEFVRFHMLCMVLQKLTRFVNSDLTHKDSVDDMVVYSAMLNSKVDGESEANKRVKLYGKECLSISEAKHYIGQPVYGFDEGEWHGPYILKRIKDETSPYPFSCGSHGCFQNIRAV